MAHGQAVKGRGERRGHLVAQVLAHLVIDAEQPVIDSKPDGHGGDRLAGAVQGVQVGGAVGGGVHLADDLVVAQHHQVMDVHIGQVIQFFIQVLEHPGVHTLLLGGGAGQVSHLGHYSEAQNQEYQYCDNASRHFTVNGMVSGLELG